jgi:hypothetical protein
MKLTPQECRFEMTLEDYKGRLIVQVYIFPKDKGHPRFDQLFEDDYESLPTYLAARRCDGECMWEFDGDCPVTADEMKSDLEALGYTHTSTTTR